MTGRIWIFAETFFYRNEAGLIDEDIPIDYVEHDYPEESSNEDKGWFFIRSECQESISLHKELMEENASKIECVPRCMCDLYRKRVGAAFKNRNYKSAIKFTYYGFIRMVKDYFEGFK